MAESADDAEGGRPQPNEAATARPLDISTMLHQARSAFLRRMPPGARVMCSAGCAANWYFEWIENCYGKVERHIGVEFYTPKPEGLPKNVEWICNTVSHMDGVGDESCDLVFSGQNLEHLWPDEVVGFLLESWRILRPGGALVIDSPNRSITAPAVWSHPEHTVEVTYQEAVKLMTIAGFDIVSTWGIWLCRDPRTGRLLPLDPQIQDDWSIAERLLCGADDPENSFIWWIEARRSDRKPDPEALQAEMTRIFDIAWPERIQRFVSGCGQVEKRPDGEWIVCRAGQPGPALYGPYMPLHPGRYEVTFTISFEGNNGSAPVGQCDVMIGSKTEPISVRTLIATELKPLNRVTLEFKLTKLEFGVQFRCISFGTSRLGFRKRVDLRGGPAGYPAA